MRFLFLVLCLPSVLAHFNPPRVVANWPLGNNVTVLDIGGPFLAAVEEVSGINCILFNRPELVSKFPPLNPNGYPQSVLFKNPVLLSPTTKYQYGDCGSGLVTVGTTAQMTLAAWVWLDSYGTDQSRPRSKFISRALPDSPPDWDLRQLNNGTLSFRVSTEFNKLAEVSGGNVSLKTWTCVVGVYTGTQSKIYQNAILRATIDNQNGIVTERAGSETHLAAGTADPWDPMDDDGFEPMNGMLQDVYVSNLDWSQDDITSFCDTPSPSASPSASLSASPSASPTRFSTDSPTTPTTPTPPATKMRRKKKRSKLRKKHSGKVYNSGHQARSRSRSGSGSGSGSRRRSGDRSRSQSGSRRYDTVHLQVGGMWEDTDNH